MSNVVTILSIDGGGIYGLIPALVLQELEKQTKRSLSSLFDLVVGTSTGGIIALGLTAPKSSNESTPRWTATDVVNVYENDGKTIFDRSSIHVLRTARGANGPVYPATGIETVLQNHFGQVRLKESLTEVMVSCYDLEHRRPYFFKSWRARQHQDRDCLMWQAARATSAAPWYFPPYRLEGSSPNQYRALVDGGVFANNPSLAGLTEARKWTQDWREPKYLVVSLGTGDATRNQRIPHEKAMEWGAFGWLGNLFSIMLDGSSSAVDHQLQTLLNEPQGACSYYRFQCHLGNGVAEFDDASDNNLRNLRVEGERLIQDSRQQLSKVAGRLLELLPQREGPAMSPSRQLMPHS